MMDVHAYACKQKRDNLEITQSAGGMSGLGLNISTVPTIMRQLAPMLSIIIIIVCSNSSTSYSSYTHFHAVGQADDEK